MPSNKPGSGSESRIRDARIRTLREPEEPNYLNFMQIFIYKPDFGPLVVFLGLSLPSWASRVIRTRCLDDSDQSGKFRIRVLDSDLDTQLFYFDAPMQNSNADAYRTVRNAVPDADAGSVVRYCTVPHLTTVPARGRTRGSGPRSGSASQSSNRVPHPFLKLKSKKKHTWAHLKVARAHFSLKISCLKFF